jgi:aspartate 1-decarboxylase
MNDSFRKLLRSKIHRATVTEANLDYEGSLTTPPDLLAAADIAEYEAINIWNVTRGTRFETYAIKGPTGSHDICVNGAAAHLTSPGDIIIVAAFCFVPESQVNGFRPRLVFVDAENRIAEMRLEQPNRAYNR